MNPDGPLEQYLRDRMSVDRPVSCCIGHFTVAQGWVTSLKEGFATVRCARSLGVTVVRLSTLTSVGPSQYHEQCGNYCPDDSSYRDALEWWHK